MPDTRIVTNVGERRGLDKIAEIPRKIALFVNNITPTATSVIGDFTKPVWSGYADQDLDDWPAASTLGTGEANITHPNVTFNYTGVAVDVTIYGIVIFDPTDNAVMEVVKYETAEVVNGAGSHIVAHSLQAETAT